MRPCDYEWGFRDGQLRCRCVRIGAGYRWWAVASDAVAYLGRADVAVQDLDSLAKAGTAVLVLPQPPPVRRPPVASTLPSLVEDARFAAVPGLGAVACDRFWSGGDRDRVDVGRAGQLVRMRYVGPQELLDLLR